MTEISSSAPISAKRIKRADEYYDNHLGGQRNWYSNKAASSKKWSQVLSVTVITAGALVSFVQIFAVETGALWTTLLTASLGVLITVAKGVDRINKFEETWVGYRKASESMKREYRLYINSAGGYTAIADEEAAFRHFVEQVEQIIAEEQQIFWQSRDESDLSKENLLENSNKQP